MSTKNLMMKSIFASFTIAASLFALSPAHAAPITFTVDGTVDSVSPGILGTFSIGDAYHLEYTFESTTPDADPSSTYGRYNFAITALSVTIGTYSATASSATITITSDHSSAQVDDSYRIDVFDFVGLPVDGFELNPGHFPGMMMRDPTKTVFTNDALPLVPPAPADFIGNNGMNLMFTVSSCSSPPCEGYVRAIIDSTGFGTPIAEVDCSGFMPPFDQPLSLKTKVKRAIPVDIVLTDDAGSTVTDMDITALPVINVLFNAQTFGEVPPNTDDLLPLGSANEDNIFRFDTDSGQWVYNLGTNQFRAAGTYTVKVASGDTSEYTINGPNGACLQTFERLPP